jgi:hypothetical protein
MKNIFLLIAILGISVLMINCSKKSPIEEMIEKNNKITSDINIRPNISDVEVSVFIDECYNNERNRLQSSCERTIDLQNKIYELSIKSRNSSTKYNSEIKNLQSKLDSINNILNSIETGTYPDAKFQEVFQLKNKFKDMNMSGYKAHLCEYSDTSHLGLVNRLIVLDTLSNVVIDIIK